MGAEDRGPMTRTITARIYRNLLRMTMKAKKMIEAEEEEEEGDEEIDESKRQRKGEGGTGKRTILYRMVPAAA